MSTTITFPLPDGASYIIPAVDDENWGQNVSNFLIALPNGVPPRSGTFTLTGDLSFGASFGLVSLYYKSRTANIATAGVVRLAKTDTIDWRNNANSGNLALGINGSNQLTFNGSTVISTSGDLTDTGTDGIVVTGGIGALISSASLAQHVADSTHNGYLSSADWTTFNSKQSTITFPLSVSNGGTGQSSYTNGQLLIGNTSGNTLAKATLTGTSNQVNVSNGSGSITLSLPQDINTGANVSFAQVSLSTAAVLQANAAATFVDGANVHLMNLSAPASISASYNLFWPTAQGGANTVLKNDGSGNMSWVSNTQNLLQTVFNKANTDTSSSATSYTDTVVTATITPTSSSNRVLITAVFNVSTPAADQLDFTIGRNSTSVAGLALGRIDIAASVTMNQTFTYVDSPGTTSATVYQVRGKSAGGGAWRIGGGVGYWTMTLQEIV